MPFNEVVTEEQLSALDRGRAAGIRARRARAAEREARGIVISKQKDAHGVTQLTRNEQLKRGIIRVWQLDDEELARHQARNHAGTFEGTRTTHAPKLVAEMDAELLKRGADITRAAYTKALMRLVSMLDHADARVAVMAVDRVMERVAGKVPDKLLSADVSPFMEAHGEIAAELARAMGYQVSETPTPAVQPQVVEGEVVAPASEAKPPKRKAAKRAPKKRPSSGGIDVSKYVR